MNPYQTHGIEGLSGVELTIALYDGIIRFIYQAISAVERGDAGARRAAVKRALDIIIYLQATLRTDIGGEPAEALGEFYVAMFALILQGSQRASTEKFQKAIEYVKNVRGAWRQVVTDQDGTRAGLEVTSSHSNSIRTNLPALDCPPEGELRTDWLA